MDCIVRVRWSDLDALGHVNNARFFTYLEEARLAWFETLKEPWYDEETGPVVARAACDFKRPINGTGEVRVRTRPRAPGNTSITLHSEIVSAEDGETVYGIGEVVLVWVNRRTGRPAPLPPFLRGPGAG